MAHFSPHVTYWRIANEILQSRRHSDPRPLRDAPHAKLAATAAYLYAIFAFGVGNPDLPEPRRMAVWQRPTGAGDGPSRRDIVAVHQYGMPDLSPFQDWYGNRLEHQILPRLPFPRH